MNYKSIILLSASCVLLCSCATLFGKKSDTINIHSNYRDAIILINGNEVGHGSATYELPRDKTAVITVHKKGCVDTSVSTNQEINNTTFVNLIFWPGYLIDAASGSIHEASQKEYTMNPNCDDKDN